MEKYSNFLFDDLKKYASGEPRTLEGWYDYYREHISDKIGTWEEFKEGWLAAARQIVERVKDKDLKFNFVLPGLLSEETSDEFNRDLNHLIYLNSRSFNGPVAYDVSGAYANDLDWGIPGMIDLLIAASEDRSLYPTVRW